MPKAKPTNQGIMEVCQALAPIVLKEYRGRDMRAYETLLEAFKRRGVYDVALDTLDNIASIVDIGMQTRGDLQPEMITELDRNLQSLIALLLARSK